MEVILGEVEDEGPRKDEMGRGVAKVEGDGCWWKDKSREDRQGDGKMEYSPSLTDFAGDYLSAARLLRSSDPQAPLFYLRENKRFRTEAVDGRWLVVGLGRRWNLDRATFLVLFPSEIYGQCCVLV